MGKLLLDLELAPQAIGVGSILWPDRVPFHAKEHAWRGHGHAYSFARKRSKHGHDRFRIHVGGV